MTASEVLKKYKKKYKRNGIIIGNKCSNRGKRYPESNSLGVSKEKEMRDYQRSFIFRSSQESNGQTKGEMNEHYKMENQNNGKGLLTQMDEMNNNNNCLNKETQIKGKK